MTQLKENDPWKFHAPSSDESGGEENVAPNGQFLFLSRPNTKGRDTDEESEYLNKNDWCHLNQNLLSGETC